MLIKKKKKKYRKKHPEAPAQALMQRINMPASDQQEGGNSPRAAYHSGASLAGNPSLSLGRDSCWYSGCLKSKYLRKKKKYTSPCRKCLCWYTQLQQFTSFLHLPWKFAKQCTLNVKHCRLVTVFVSFSRSIVRDGTFFLFYLFFPKGKEKAIPYVKKLRSWKDFCHCMHGFICPPCSALRSVLL